MKAKWNIEPYVALANAGNHPMTAKELLNICYGDDVDTNRVGNGGRITAIQNNLKASGCHCFSGHNNSVYWFI